MLRQLSTTLAFLLALNAATTAQARLWTSLKGNVQIEGEAITFNEELVVLRKPTGELVALELKDLCEADREYVQSKERVETDKKSAEEMQTWTAKDGMKVRGRVVAYGRKELVVQRKFGKVHFDDKKFSAIDPLHQKLLLKILSHLENKKLEDERQLEEWGKSLGGTPKTITLDGVLMELESGDQIGVPFFLFAPEELAILRPGWELWLERQESEQAQEQESFLVRSAAMAYQRDRAAQQQIEIMKLDLLGAATGVIAIWQVGLIPAQGSFGRPMSIMVPAQNSQAAVNIALQRNPGYVLVGVRRASR